MAEIELAPATADELAWSIAKLVDGPHRRVVKAGFLILYEAKGSRDPIAVMRLSRPAFGSVKNGAITASKIEDGFAAREGRIGWAEVCNSEKEPVFSCDVGEKDATLIVNKAEVENGAPITVKSLTVRMPRSKAHG